MLQMWGPCINRDGIVPQSCANLSGFRIKVRKDSQDFDCIYILPSLFTIFRLRIHNISSLFIVHSLSTRAGFEEGKEILKS